MKKYMCLLFLLCSLSVCAHRKENIQITLYIRDYTSIFDVTPEGFDSTLKETHCRYVAIRNKINVSEFMSELESLQDSAVYRNANQEYEYIIPKDTLRAEHPFMDTEGKFVVKYPGRNVTYYYSLAIVWNKNKNHVYKMSDKLRKIILSYFFTKHWKLKKTKRVR